MKEQILIWRGVSDLPEKSYQVVFRTDYSIYLNIGTFDGNEFYDFEYYYSLDCVTEWAYI